MNHSEPETGLSRRDALAAASLLGAGALLGCQPLNAQERTPIHKPVALSTWSFGLPANRAAWEILMTGGTSLDAVEAGVRVPEADPKVRSVGLGGLPNASGFVELDACIMDGARHRAGAVAALQGILHPVSVARRVMEQTPHVLLVGAGARQFATQQGFEPCELLTAEARTQWQAWRDAGGIYQHGHDTIGMLALDARGNLAGACTTSGLAYKLPGRVGDSPLIGPGLYVDNAVGAATATGVGEEVIQICGSHRIVMAMEAGATPQQAVDQTVEHLLSRRPHLREDDGQVAFLALNRRGEYGAAALRAGFQYALSVDGETVMHRVTGHLE